MAYNFQAELSLLNTRLSYVQNRWDLVAIQYADDYATAYGEINTVLERKKEDQAVLYEIGTKFIEAFATGSKLLESYELAVEPALAGIFALLGRGPPAEKLPDLKAPNPWSYGNNIKAFLDDLFAPILKSMSDLAALALKRSLPEEDFRLALDSILRSSLWYPPEYIRQKRGTHLIKLTEALWTIYMRGLVDSYRGGDLRGVIAALIDIFPARAWNADWQDETDATSGMWQQNPPTFEHEFAWLWNNRSYFVQKYHELQPRAAEIFLPISRLPADLRPETKSFAAHLAPAQGRSAAHTVPEVTITVGRMLEWKDVPYPWPEL